jgi:uncharacterized protein (TIGR03663 family)
MHTDEAVHALIIGDMLAGKAYAYNPRDFHGPAFYFLAEPLLRLMGVRSLATLEAWQLRLVPALTWSALILLLPLLRSGLGSVGVIAAGGLLTIVAPFCYFSTDFIHESLFLFATVFSIVAGWRFSQAPGALWAIALGAGIGLMVATKETVVLTLAAGGLACVAIVRWKPGTSKQLIPLAAIIVAVAVVVAALFFTSFGSQFDGLRNLISAGGNFTARAGGQGHEKPWWTYLDWVFTPNPRSWPFGGWILALLFLAGVLLARHRPLVRFLAWFSLGLWIFYSAIPYKTPWLELNFLVPMALVGGAGVRELWFSRWIAAGLWGRVAIGLVAIGFCVLLTSETYRLCSRFSADPMNPLAYAASSNDVKRLESKVTELLGQKPAAVVQVVTADSWPLPWYLRKFPNVGYWPKPPASLTGDVLILSPETSGTIRQNPNYRLVGMYGTRPEMLAFVYVREGKGTP